MFFLFFYKNIKNIEAENKDINFREWPIQKFREH